MADKLSVRLDDAWRKLYGDGDEHDVCDTLAEAIAALEAAQAERDAMREALKDADNELDWLDEDVDTCDHSVGVCMCSYWRMRQKMKAALGRGGVSND